MFQPLDGPAAQIKIAVDTVTVKELKIGGATLIERKIIEIQPLDGKIYYYYGDGASTPSAATITANGFFLRKEQIRIIEASDTQPVFMIADAGTVNVAVAERA